MRINSLEIVSYSAMRLLLTCHCLNDLRKLINNLQSLSRCQVIFPFAPSQPAVRARLVPTSPCACLADPPRHPCVPFLSAHPPCALTPSFPSPLYLYHEGIDISGGWGFRGLPPTSLPPLHRSPTMSFASPVAINRRDRLLCLPSVSGQ